MMAASSAMAGALRMRMPAEVSCSTTAERTHRCRLGCHVAGLGCGLGKSSLLMKVKRAAGSPSCVRAAMEPQHVEGAKKAVAREPGSFSESASWQSKISQLVPAVPEWVQLGLGETLRFLQRPAVVAMIVAAVLMCTPDFAMAAQGGGRVGGRVSQGSRSYSAPAQTYSAPSTTYIAPSYSAPFFAPSPFFGGWGWSPFYAGPTVVVGGGGGGLGGLFTVVLVGAVLVVVANSVFGFLGGEEEDDVYSTTTSVMKLQVGLLGMARTLQKDLDRIGERADTSSAEGLHYVLTETVLSLLRHPDYCVYGTSMTDIKSNAEAGEARFNSLSLEERGKFREETLVNVGAVQRGSSRLASTDRFTSEYIVVTIIVAADGRVQLPDVNSAPSLREALTILGSVPVDAIQAVEILWTPQRDGDTLSATEMLADYPQLRSL